MTAPALIKQAELDRMAVIAKKRGVPIEVEVNGRIFRVLPDIPINHKSEPVALPDDYAF